VGDQLFAGLAVEALDPQGEEISLADGEGRAPRDGMRPTPNWPAPAAGATGT
jgi:hypothetical protein